MDPNKQRVLIKPVLSIRETMQVINQGALGISLVVDSDGRLQGTVTDGDIRRALLKGMSLDEPVSKVMNNNPVTVTWGADTQHIRQIMLRHELKQIPVLDELGRVVDIVMVSTLLRTPLSSPDITYQEVKAVLDVLSTPDLSLGPKMYEFEEKFAAYIGAKHAVAVNSGTSGLHLCIKSLDIGDGDEVITTPFSFIASANCILFERAIPVFVDIDPLTLNIGVNKIEEKITPRTKAILPVHVFGQPCDMSPLVELASRHHLTIIEDSCEAIGAEYKGRKTGTFGQCGVFSFYPNKQMTTAEGGVIVTDDLKIARLCQSYRNQGRGESSEWLNHDRIGYNYRLSELQCALGIVQLERIEELLSKREAVANIYNKRLSQVKGIRIPHIQANVKMSWFVYVVQLDTGVSGLADRDEILIRLRNRGIACGNYFPPIHLQPFYRKQFGYKEGDFPITEEISRRTIALPFFNNLLPEDIDHICQALEKSIIRVHPSRAK